jgi:GT2 family glycosyltransferase
MFRNANRGLLSGDLAAVSKVQAPTDAGHTIFDAVARSISVIIVAYNSGPALTRCLRSLGQQEVEVVVVNNGERGPEVGEAERLAGVHVVSPPVNLGFAAGCNLGAERSSSEVLVFLNPDTVVAPGAIPELAGTLEDPTIGIAMPRLRLLDQPELLNSGGNVVHLTGLAWAGHYGEPAEDIREIRDIAYPTGAAMAIRAELFRELGGFTEELFMYQEDLELGWRVRLCGLRVVVTPRADVYHEYEYARNVQKQYLLERNRLVFVLSAFSGRLLALLAPVLVAGELSMLALAAKEGWWRDKVAGWGWCVRHARWLLGHRRETQRLRRVADRELAPLLTPVIDPAMIEVPSRVRAANKLVAWYWSIARRAL